MLGGGGITPDVTVADSAVDAQASSLQAALGKHVAEFRDVLTDYALELKGQKRITTASVIVTPTMRSELYERLRQRGVSIPRTVYDVDSSVVNRLVADQITRYVFGPDAEYELLLHRDPDVAAALGMLARSRTQEQLLRAAQR